MNVTATVAGTGRTEERRLLPRVGISFPTPMPTGGVPLTGRELIEGAQHIEELGFHGIWMADVIGRGYFCLEPLTGLAAVAGATRSLELGTGILQVPLSEPVGLARRVLTAALAADGRLVLGVGAGSTPADFEAVGSNFERRFKVFDESLSTIKALWRGERVGGARLDPWPAMLGGPPVLIGSWVGGSSEPRPSTTAGSGRGRTPRGRRSSL
jgi:alkanesulfonate monooxygenase SsuD/methylene tetrahydromethanopterin reductase-like flavin-dependent oxidoreductase (luciferase family)